jgi:hypothetical protein
MSRGLERPILPRTWKSRTLLAIAFVTGMGLLAGGIAFTILNNDLVNRIEVKIENRTSGDVTIFVDGEAEAVVAPSETETISELEMFWKLNRFVQAVSSDGSVLFYASLSKGDLQRMDYRIVIEGP